MDKTRYPADWPALSRRIRFERARGKCEWCGVRHGAVGARDRDGGWHDEASIHSMNSTDGFMQFPGGFPTMVKIVLTVAHLDHDTANNDDANLVALCQKCHLGHDRDIHMQHARETRRRKQGFVGLPLAQEAEK